MIESIRCPRRIKLFRSALCDRIKYTKVDAETGDEVASEGIVKGYKVDTDTYVTVDEDGLENIALESTRTIDIDEFVPRSEIDELYLVRPYYIVPDGQVGHEPVGTAVKSRDTGNVINLMDALRRSLTTEGKASTPSAAAKKQSKKAPAGQREMLMAIPGKGEGKKAAAKEPKKSRPARARKAG